MYNALLNKLCIEELKEYVAGKRVLMVGNAATIFSDPAHGDIIDSYDVVLRFGKGVPYTKYKDFLGSKKDIWFFGTARAGMWNHFLTSRFRIMTISQIALYKEDEGSLMVSKEMFNGNLQIYKDFMLAGDTAYYVKMGQDINGTFDEKTRLSQGAQAVHFFDTVVGTQSSISLIGFDFFEHEFSYHYETRKKSRIPKEHHVGSWHMPLTAPNFEHNPHILSKEKEYFASVKNLHVHKAPDFIDKERLSTLLKELRGERATLLGVS